MLINAADKWDCDRFAARVLALTQDKALAEEFRRVREVADSVKGMALDDAVGLCRANAWNLGPGWALAIAAASVLAQKAESEQRLKELETNKPKP